jgi:hypothetical protein
MDSPACEPDAPYIAYMQAHMTGYRGNGYSMGKQPRPAKDHITIGEVSFYGSDNLMGPSTPGDPLEGRLLASNGEVLWEQNLGDPLRSEYGGRDGLRETDLVLGVQLYPGGVFYQVFDTVEQESIVVLDLRPHIQRLCAEQPCLKLCRSPEDAGADGAGADALASDGGVVDAVASDSRASD